VDTTPRAVTPTDPRVAVSISILGAAVTAGFAGWIGMTAIHHFRSPALPPAVPAPSVALPPPPSPAPTCPDEMVYVPGGQFFMGSDDGMEKDKPSHNVRLSPFCIGIYEVTTSKYLACSDTGRCKRASRVDEWQGITAAQRKTYDPLCNINDPVAHAQEPINCVDWDRAQNYCQATGGRLPTEAEWEFAARGSDGRQYPWGDEPPSARYLNACGSECVAWQHKHHEDEKAMYASDDGWPNTAPVGSFPLGKSRYGLMDVVGNVWEWVADWYSPYTSGAAVDPKGPASGKARVIRGGAWNGGEASWVRPTFRFMRDPTALVYAVGFRCAADPK